MTKYNCWEYMNCGKGLNGNGSNGSHTCPAASFTLANGLNGGLNGGRICWVIAETCCRKKLACNKSGEKDPCFACEFRYKVMADEGLLNVCKATGILLTQTDSLQKR